MPRIQLEGVVLAARYKRQVLHGGGVLVQFRAADGHNQGLAVLGSDVMIFARLHIFRVLVLDNEVYFPLTVLTLGPGAVFVVLVVPNLGDLQVHGFHGVGGDPGGAVGLQLRTGESAVIRNVICIAVNLHLHRCRLLTRQRVGHFGLHHAVGEYLGLFANLHRPGQAREGTLPAVGLVCAALKLVCPHVEHTTRHIYLIGIGIFCVICKEGLGVLPFTRSSAVLSGKSHLQLKVHRHLAEVVRGDFLVVLVHPLLLECDACFQAVFQVGGSIKLAGGFARLKGGGAGAGHVNAHNIPADFLRHLVDPRHAVGGVPLQLSAVLAGDGVGPGVPTIRYSPLDFVTILVQSLQANGIVLPGLGVRTAGNRQRDDIFRTTRPQVHFVAPVVPLLIAF